MSSDQTRNNPDVNSFGINDEPEGEGGNQSIEDIPLPPDTESPSPIEEPPEEGGSPVGDVDDSPEKIA